MNRGVGFAIVLTGEEYQTIRNIWHGIPFVVNSSDWQNAKKTITPTSVSKCEDCTSPKLSDEQSTIYYQPSSLHGVIRELPCAFPQELVDDSNFLGEFEGIMIEEDVYQGLLQKYPEQDKGRLFCEKHAVNFRHVEVDKAD